MDKATKHAPRTHQSAGHSMSGNLFFLCRRTLRHNIAYAAEHIARPVGKFAHLMLGGHAAEHQHGIDAALTPATISVSILSPIMAALALCTPRSLIPVRIIKGLGLPTK